jgi:decaprenylphospho-beta-D-ribofuranose 2-oxidase
MTEPTTTRRRLGGWGRTALTPADVLDATERDDLVTSLDHVPERGVIARGLGRSYGDSAQNAGGLVVDATRVSGLLDLDLQKGVVTALAGTSLDELIRWLVPLGWFVPTTPGTRQITVGGAIAADVHGKNHHRVGSWCESVLAFTLATPARGVITVTPESEPELFWATAGGLGLTGVVVDATFRLERIESSYLSVDVDRTADLDATLELMASTDDRYDSSVAWIDLLAPGASLGRSILTRGHFATLDQLDRRRRREPLAFHSGTLASVPPVFPSGLLNGTTVRLFNEAWYRKAPKVARGDLQTITEFFHPLDMLADWNRIYGPRGFVQWQGVVPLAADDDLRWIVNELNRSGRSSFLAVLKRCRVGNAGPLSFPMEGWTLALDLPVDRTDDLGALLDRLDERVVAAGGRIYLAKDSRVRPELLATMYPRLDEWRAVRRSIDPEQTLRSDLARRLSLADERVPAPGRPDRSG